MSSLIDDPEVQASLVLLDAQVGAAKDEQDIPGLSIAVILDQTTLWTKGYGYTDVERRITAGPHTIYRIGSITKLFTATMLMQLRDAGRLHLDDPVEKFLPEFRVKSRFPDAKPPTFRQLASHTAGLPLEAPLEYGYHFTETFPSPDELLASLRYLEMCLPAMTQYRYSNLGYNVLGYALARAANQPYAEYVETHILQPLDMASTSYRVTPAMEPYVAVGYEPETENVPRQVARFQNYGLPAGMLWSSVADLGRFVALQFRNGSAGGTQILGGSTIREMHLPVFMTSGWKDAVGIGWHFGEIAGQRVSQHNGGTSGYTSAVVVAPELKFGLAMCANTTARPWDIARACLETLLPVVRRAIDRARAANVSFGVGSWRRYVGQYRLETAALGVVTDAQREGAGMHIRLDGETLELALHIPDLISFTFTLEPFAEHIFRLQHGPFAYAFGGELVLFGTDEHGVVVTAAWRDFSFQRVATAAARPGCT